MRFSRWSDDAFEVRNSKPTEIMQPLDSCKAVFALRRTLNEDGARILRAIDDESLKEKDLNSAAKPSETILNL